MRCHRCCPLESQIYYEVSMTRCLTRFVGTTDALEAIKNDSWAGRWEDKRVRQLTAFQVRLLPLLPSCAAALTENVCFWGATKQGLSELL